jgi:tetratricopeptide (TPR) repeat protein
MNMTDDTISSAQSELLQIVEEVKASKTLLLENPESKEFCEQYFWSLQKEGKFRIEHQDLQRAVACLREMVQNRNRENDEQVLALGWMIVQILKGFAADEYFRKQFVALIPGLIAMYIELKVPVPSQLHSAMLGMANKLAQEPAAWFVALIKAYGLDCFQSVDFEEHYKDGRKHTALVEMITVKTAKFMEKEKNEADMNWLLSYAERFIAKMPNNYLLIYHHGRLLLALGRGDEAKERLYAVLLKQKNQYWAWAAYGETLRNSDKQSCLACLCKSLSFPVEEHMLLIVREALVRLLVELEMYVEAKTEVEQILRFHKDTMDKVSPDIKDMVRTEWFATAASKNSNLNFYLGYLKNADKILYSDKAGVNGIVTAFYDEDKGVFIQFELDKVALYKFQKTSLPKSDFYLGKFVKVAVDAVTINGQQRYTALRVESTEETPAETFFRRYSGELKIPQKNETQSFGFVEDVFIPGDLFKKTPGLKKVTGTCIKEFNKKRNTYGWRALIIQERQHVEEPKAPEVTPPAAVGGCQTPVEQNVQPVPALQEPAAEPVVQPVTPDITVPPIEENAPGAEPVTLPDAIPGQVQQENSPAAE